MVAHALHPGAQLLLAAGVAQRQHGLEVVDVLELLQRAPAHALRRGVGRLQLGVLPLERPQLVEQRVVGVVADLGVVEDVVAVVVVLDDPPQLGGALLYRCERPFHLAIAV